MSAVQLAAFEDLVGWLLDELGYGRSSQPRRGLRLHARWLRATYLAMFEMKQWMKITPLGGMVNLKNIGLEESEERDSGARN